MALQIGGSTPSIELAGIVNDLSHIAPISDLERQQRREKAVRLMQLNGVAALVLTASSSLYYFTGLSWHQSERLVGAVLTREGELIFISPVFEESKLRETIGDKVRVALWEEEDSPYSLVNDILRSEGLQTGPIALDEAAPFFIVDGLRHAMPARQIINGKLITAECRMHKSGAELELMQAAKNITLKVQRSAARILREGISSVEVAQFINQAHQAFGGSSSSFCIVSFGVPTSIPHGPDGVQYLKEGDMVLIDTGCKVGNYHSDITRSYVFGQPSARQCSMWELEKAAQAAAFEAAQLGVPCSEVDAAARRLIEAAAKGATGTPPRLPHRTGHGIGLDIHEWTYLVKGNQTPLAPGMCFSNEPTICLDGEFGIRLEDHFYMTEHGPQWFTEPSVAVDLPFPL